MKMPSDEVLDDPELLRAFVVEELAERIRQHPVMRADEIKHFRLVYHGTQGAGVRIIPFAEHVSK